jgi:hypothetical protein
MKRADLRVGAEYMYANRKWDVERFSGDKVTLVDLGPFVEGYQTEPLALADLSVVPAPKGRYAKGHRRSDKGQLVAVRGAARGSLSGDRVTFVRTATLVAAWVDAEAAAMLTEDQFNRLPKAAQREIDRLRRDLAFAHERLAAGPETGIAYIDHAIDSAARQWLAEGSRVSFVVGESRRIIVRLEGDNRLAISSDGGGLLVRPWVSNAIRVSLEEN